jgi:hypothetical protein
MLMTVSIYLCLNTIARKDAFIHVYTCVCVYMYGCICAVCS